MNIEIGKTYKDDTGKEWLVTKELPTGEFLLKYVTPCDVTLEQICARCGGMSYSHHHLINEEIKRIDLNEFSFFSRISPPEVKTKVVFDDETPKISYSIQSVANGGISLQGLDAEKAGWLFWVITHILEEVTNESFKLGQDSIKHNLKALLK